MVKSLSRPDGEGIGDNYFFKQSDGKDKKPLGDMCRFGIAVVCIGKLGHHLFVVDDRTGDELREKGNKKRVIQKVVLFGFMTVTVHQIGNLLKGKEADRQRQNQMQQRYLRTEEEVCVIDEKVGIFKIAQQRQIDADTEKEQKLRFSAVYQFLSYQIVKNHRSQNQRQVNGIPPAVKEE